MRLSFISSIVLIMLLYYTSILFKGAANAFLDESNCYFFLISLYLGFLSYVAVSTFRPFKKTQIKKIDVFLLAIWGIFEISIFLNSDMHFADDGIILINSLFVLYFLLRLFNVLVEHTEILCFILFSGFIFELGIGIYQLITVRLSEVNMLTINGTFYNSGIYMGYIVGLGPFAYFSLNRIRNKWLKRTCFLICGGVMLSFLFITESRAATIGLIITVASLYLYYKNGFKHWAQKAIPVVIFLLLAGASIFVKQNSSAGRWLIWKITFQNVIKHPLLGYGPMSFSRLYPSWQGAYFLQGKGNDMFSGLADVSHVAFNEYLQILAETGIVGLTVFGLLVLLIFRTKADPERNELMITFKASAFIFLLFAMFSYPFRVEPILVVFIISLAAIVHLSNETPAQFSLSHKVSLTFRFISFCASAYIACWFCRHLIAVTAWENVEQVAVNDEREYSKNYRELDRTLYSCSPFLLKYGENLITNKCPETAIRVLKKSIDIYPSEEGYILLGSALELNKDFNGAGECYKTLISIVPGHFVPKYLLVKIHLEQHDSTEAKSLAKEIVNMPVKVPSDQVFQIRTEMKSFLNKNP